MWKQPERIMQHAALELLRKYKKVPGHFIELYEYLITAKSWWDTVDAIATNSVGFYFQQFPGKTTLVTGR